MGKKRMKAQEINLQEHLISFIILVYRHFDGITRTLQSVFEQDYPQIEIIISDDGSDNYVEEIEAVRAYVDAHRTENIIRVVYNHLEENQGTVRNANSALRLAKGKYIKNLGADDTLASPGALRRYVDFLEKSACLICFSKLQGVDDDGKIIRNLASCADDYEPFREMTPLEIRDRLFVRNFLPAPAWFAKRELFEKYGYYPETARLIEDYPYWIHLCTEGIRFAFMDDVLVNYRLSGISSAGFYSEAFMKDMYAIYDEWIFPCDKRYGVLQPVYNTMKRAGLNAYTDRARWKKYSIWQKIAAWLKHGVFFVYIDYGNYRMKKKNEAQNGTK